jgi:hypothetical protein
VPSLQSALHRLEGVRSEGTTQHCFGHARREAHLGAAGWLNDVEVRSALQEAEKMRQKGLDATRLMRRGHEELVETLALRGHTGTSEGMLRGRASV